MVVFVVFVVVVVVVVVVFTVAVVFGVVFIVVVVVVVANNLVDFVSVCGEGGLVEVTGDGVTTEVQEAGGAGGINSVDDLKVEQTLLSKTQASLGFVNDILSAAKAEDFSSIATAVSEISVDVFLQKAFSFMILIAQDFASTEIEAMANELLSFKIVAISEAITTQIGFLMSTIMSYSLQVSAHVALINTKVSSLDPGGFTEEKNANTLTMFREIRGDFESLMSSLETAKTSASTAGTTAAVTLVQAWLRLVVLISGHTNSFSTIQAQMSTEVQVIQDFANNVTPFSAKLLLMLDGIASSVLIHINIITVQIGTITIETTTAIDPSLQTSSVTAAAISTKTTTATTIMKTTTTATTIKTTAQITSSQTSSATTPITQTSTIQTTTSLASTTTTKTTTSTTAAATTTGTICLA